MLVALSQSFTTCTEWQSHPSNTFPANLTEQGGAVFLFQLRQRWLKDTDGRGQCSDMKAALAPGPVGHC